MSDNSGLLSSRYNRNKSLAVEINNIKYPTPSKMREMLAHDGQILYQGPPAPGKNKTTAYTKFSPTVNTGSNEET